MYTNKLTEIYKIFLRDIDSIDANGTIIKIKISIRHMPYIALLYAFIRIKPLKSLD